MNTEDANQSGESNYGDGDATFHAVGGLRGLQSLVEDFYRIMDTSIEYKKIRDMHPEQLGMSIDKLVSFLSGWMGSEPLYFQKYGGAGMPKAHMHLTINTNERDMWLSCMNEALQLQSYPEDLINYLNEQFLFPAERIHQVSLANNKN